MTDDRQFDPAYAQLRSDLASFKNETGQTLDNLTTGVAEVKNAVAGLAYVTATTMGEDGHAPHSSRIQALMPRSFTCPR